MDLENFDTREAQELIVKMSQQNQIQITRKLKLPYLHNGAD